jgi:hypothetical protein
MLLDDPQALRDRIRELTGRDIRPPIRITGDTVNFFAVQPDMVVRLDGRGYFIRGHAVEGRFGIDDQPKFWVKYALDLETGRRVVLKLTFYEDFTTRIGPFLLKAHRSPEKESRILDRVRDHPHFMQGKTVPDDKGHPVRVIEFIRGPNFFQYLNQVELDHETYYHQMLRPVMTRLLGAFEAMADLFRMGEQHGDIRIDHLLVSTQDDRYVWIDFDYQVAHGDYDLWCLGNLIVFAVGKGNHTLSSLHRHPGDFPHALADAAFGDDDMLMVHPHRLSSLGKVFPYLPDPVIRLLKNFSAGTRVFYDQPEPLLNDFREALESLPES